MEPESNEKLRQLVEEAVNHILQEKKQEKPEHMTHLRGDVLVNKDHPRIAFRGAIDSLEADIILVQNKAEVEGRQGLKADLQEIINLNRWLLRCEVTGEPVGERTIQGLTTDEIRAHSHHPSQYYGRGHFLPTVDHGEMVAHLNRLRTRAREAELIAYRAFYGEEGEKREDILRMLNRLSSIFWIMMFKYLAGSYEQQGKIPGCEVEASGRHVHLSRGDVEALFGEGYQLKKVRDLSQPGQYVCKERVAVIGPKGTIENVVVLGPERKETQVEVSLTDGRYLGIEPPVRLSGDIAGSPGAVLANGDRNIIIPCGVIVAKRHVHVSEEDAKRWHILDGKVLDVEVLGKRPVIFKDTVARVSKDFATYLHIDYDEANACGFHKGIRCRFLGTDKETDMETEGMKNTQVQAKTTEKSADFTQKTLIKEADLHKAAQEGCKKLMLGSHTKLTPLAQDYVQQHYFYITRQ